MFVLISPLQTIVDPEYGTESLAAYLFLKYILRTGLEGIAIVGNLNVPLHTGSFRIIEIKKWKTTIDFTIKACIHAMKVLCNVGSRRDIVYHHMMPTYIGYSFNPLILHRDYLMHKVQKVVIGPVLYPQKFLSIDERLTLTSIKIPLMHFLSQMYNKTKRIFEIMFEEMLRKADVVIFESKAALLFCKKKYDISLSHYKIIPLPLDIYNISFSPTLVYKSRKPIVLASIGKLSLRKGHHEFLVFLKLLDQERIPFKAYIIGSGPLRDTLKRLSIKLGLKDRVIITSMSRSKLLTTLQKAVDIVVVCSYSEASLPYVIKEALASGKLVIARKLPQFTEYLKNMENCILFNNIYEALELFKKVYFNKRLLVRILRKGRELAEKAFSPDIAIRELLKAYYT